MRDPHQQQLSPLELSERKRENEYLLNVILSQFEECYDLLSPEHFIIAMVDCEGYILHMAGSEQLKSEFAERNCAPGFRWREEDVGTTAISLCLKHKLPIQLMGQEHFCEAAHRQTSAAAPIFGEHLPTSRPRIKAGPLEAMEREMIQATLQQTEGNMVQAAGILGISRATLYRKVKTYSATRLTTPAGRSD